MRFSSDYYCSDWSFETCLRPVLQTACETDFEFELSLSALSADCMLINTCLITVIYMHCMRVRIWRCEHASLTCQTGFD